MNSNTLLRNSKGRPTNSIIAKTTPKIIELVEAVAMDVTALESSSLSGIES
jgi:putative protein kinase ArgK-like GTPase of G3E family